MKVLLINGSPRQEGNTATALKEVAKQLNTEGIDSEIVWIGNKPIRGCIACGQCKIQGLGRCIFDDDICNKISNKFEETNDSSSVHLYTMVNLTEPCSQSSNVPFIPMGQTSPVNLPLP